MNDIEIDTQVKAALTETLERMEKCEELLKKFGDPTHELDAKYQNLKRRRQRLAICSDILSGNAYVVVEKNKDGFRELFVHKGKDTRLISLAEKMGLNAEVQQGRLT